MKQGTYAHNTLELRTPLTNSLPLPPATKQERKERRKGRGEGGRKQRGEERGEEERRGEEGGREGRRGGEGRGDLLKRLQGTSKQNQVG